MKIPKCVNFFAFLLLVIKWVTKKEKTDAELLCLSKYLPYIEINSSVLSVCFSFVLNWKHNAPLQAWKVWTMNFSEPLGRIIERVRDQMLHICWACFQSCKARYRETCSHIDILHNYLGDDVLVALPLLTNGAAYSHKNVLKCRMCMVPAAFNSIILPPSLLQREMFSNVFCNGL